jgi:hypothetical protein
MFKRLGRAFNKNKIKLRIDIQFSKLEGLPDNVTSCRVIWARDSKIQMTKPVAPSGGTCTGLPFTTHTRRDHRPQHSL